MYMFLSVLVIAIFCMITIKMFMKDSNHDLKIQAGKFKFSIKKHDNE
jgi:hypothetical protein